VGTGRQLVGGGNSPLWRPFNADAVIQTGIWQAADGSYAPGDPFLVWNGATDLVQAAAPEDNCDDWTSTAGTGHAGIFQQAQSQYWARGGADNCTATAYLYCVER
jgi:hypothetical protein